MKPTVYTRTTDMKKEVHCPLCRRINRVHPRVGTWLNDQVTKKCRHFVDVCFTFPGYTWTFHRYTEQETQGLYEFAEKHGINNLRKLIKK
jgi:hypothetical protein